MNQFIRSSSGAVHLISMLCQQGDLSGVTEEGGRQGRELAASVCRVCSAQMATVSVILPSKPAS